MSRETAGRCGGFGNGRRSKKNLLSKLAGFVDGGFDGGDGRRAEISFLEGGQSGDGGSSRGGHAVAQEGGMFVIFRNHARGSEDGLGGQGESLVTGEAFEETAVGEGFDESVNVSRPASGNPGHCIDQFFRHFVDQAGGTEEALHKVGIVLAGGAAEGEGPGSLADEGWGVGHAADDAGLILTAFFHRLDGDAGGDRDREEVVRTVRKFGHPGEKVVNLVGFYAEHQGVAARDDVIERLGGGNVGAQGFDRRGLGIEGQDGVILENASLESSESEGRAHLSASDDSKCHGRKVDRKTGGCRVRPLFDCRIASGLKFYDKTVVQKLWLLAVMGIGLLPVRAEDFEVESVIHPVVADLAPPELIEGFGEGQMAITTTSDVAAQHFAQGLTKLNAAWDFEAYRHFCEAAKLDPECLMAYWGIGFSLAGSQHEFFDERKNAVNRMLDLLEAEKESGEDRWNGMETGFAQAAAFLFTDGVDAAGQTFAAIATKYPANLQARMLALFLQRDGFDTSGDPKPGQRKAVEGLRALLEEHPENLSVMSVWVNSQTEAPGQADRLREEVLPVALKLVERFPQYPPFHLMLAHTEARCGNAARAQIAATTARELFESYLEREKVSLYDCGGLVRARLYQANLHQSRGDLEAALAVAEELAAIEVDEARVFSEGAALLMWEGRTVGARLTMSAEDAAGLQQGQNLLATLKDEAWFKEKSFAIYYRDCLGFYLAVRRAVVDGDLKAGKNLFDQFLVRVRAMEKKRPLAAKTSSYSNWLRAMTVLRMALPELRGLLAELGSGATKLTAANWYRSATDRQERPGNLLPPSVPYPMALRLGDHYFGQEEFAKAASWYRQGLDLRPNHLELMAALRKTLIALGEKQEAANLEQKIEALAK